MPKKIKAFLQFVGVGLLVLVVLFFTLIVYPLEKITFPEKNYEVLVIKHISIIDLKKDCVLQNRTLVIANDRIAEITGEGLPIDTMGKNVKIMDGTHLYALPALWDMHVHLTKQAPYGAYPAFVAYGITHVRDMRGAHNEADPFAGVQAKLEQWNKEVQSFALLGPRLHGFTSFAIDGPHAMYNGLPSFFNCATPEDAKQLVAYLAHKKVTLIKVYNNIPREAFFTLMQEAKKAGIDVAGHKPVQVSTIEASDAGMKSIEHARFFIWDSYSGSDSLRSMLTLNHTVNTAVRVNMLRNFDSVRLNQNMLAFKRNKTWYCPTHLTRKEEAFADDLKFRARYNASNPVLRFLSLEDLDAIVQEDRSALGRKVFMDFYLKGLKISNEASNMGVKLLAGSDVPQLPGSSLHEELGELSKAGLPPFEILRTATLYPAQYYGLEHAYGSIEKGKKADLLLVSRNPIDAIANTAAISDLVVEGTHLDAVFLQRVKAKVKKREQGIVMTAKLFWDVLVYVTVL